MPTLNPQSPIPLYLQLAQILLSKVRSGEYAPGAAVPSEHRLADAYRIGRPTARQATEQLVRKGILERRRGAGTFVRERQVEVDLFSFGGTIASFRRTGVSITTRVLQKTRLKKIPADAGNPFAGRSAYFLSRLTRADGRPVLIENMYLDADLFADIDLFDLNNRSLSQIVDEQYYLRPAGGKQHFDICYLSGKPARELGVTGETPVLAVRRYIHFAPAENGVYAELYCRTGGYIFSQKIGGFEDEKPGLL